MILIVDNSEFRLKSLIVRLRTKGYLVCGIDYNYLDAYTKPFMTVYVNPPRQEIERIKNDDTISVIFNDRNDVDLPLWTVNYNSLNNLESEIISIYNEKFPYMIKNKVDVVGYACRKNDLFAVGGKTIKLSKMQLSVVNLFFYNPTKKFKVYEASDYMHFTKNREVRFERIVYEINKKLKDENREKLILHDGDTYYFNPEIKNYKCSEYVNSISTDENAPIAYVNFDIAYDL